jgi:hypothetical protein
MQASHPRPDPLDFFQTLEVDRAEGRRGVTAKPSSPPNEIQILSSMSTPDSCLSTFRPIFTEALEQYKQKTKTDLLTHPLFTKIKDSDTSEKVIDILASTCDAFANDFQKKAFKWIKPMVHVLTSITSVMGDGSTVVSACLFACFLVLIYTTKAIFSGIGVLLQVLCPSNGSR